MRFNDFSKQYQPKINSELQKIFDSSQDKIFEFMNYALLSEGKRLRPLITLLAIKTLGKQISDLEIKASVPVELIHSYSLIHDDLPEMDNDELRRNEPTTWKKYGVGNAVLAGDGLLTYAFKLLAGIELPDPIKIKLIYSLSLAAGPENMVRGQQYDLFSEKNVENVDDLAFVHLMKTGALFAYAATAGGNLAGASDDAIRNLNIFGLNFGIAFQFADDLNDFQKDQTLEKHTILNFMNIEEAQKTIDEYKQLAKAAIENISDIATQPWFDLLELI
jgi:geranylgeranyl diphosphate synthase type II